MRFQHIWGSMNLVIFLDFEGALPQSFLNYSRNQRELRKDENFFIFQKYKLSAFKRTFSRLIWPISRRERSEWTFYIFGFFCYKNPKSRNKQPHPLMLKPKNRFFTSTIECPELLHRKRWWRSNSGVKNHFFVFSVKVAS